MRWPFSTRAPTPTKPPQIDTYIHRNQRPPTRTQANILASFAQNPRLFAVASRVAEGVATPEWRAYRMQGSSAKSVYRDLRSAKTEEDRREITDDLQQVDNSLTLDFWNRSNPDLTAFQIRKVMQLSLDLTGDSFSVIERNGLKLPLFIYPVASTWVTPPDGRTPVNGQRQYLINGGGFTSKTYNAEDIFRISYPNPNDPYGRGVGVGMSLANEIDVDEYAAQMAASKFFNGGIPEHLIRLEGLGEPELAKFKQRFLDTNRGPGKIGQPHFTNAKGVTVERLDQSLVDMDVVEFRRFAAEVIRETFGVPPEVMGNIDNSNRATISAAYYLFAMLCLVPRLRVIEDAINQCLVPKFGEDNVIITYESPVPADAEAEQSMRQAVPTVFTMNELRATGGAEPRDDGDELYSDGMDTMAIDEQAPVDSESDLEEGVSEDPEAEAADPVAASADPAAQGNQDVPAASQLSLNGAQVTAAKEIVLDVAYGRLPRESGKSMLMSFFGLTAEQAEQILGEVGKTFEPAPEGGAVSPPAETQPPAETKPKAKPDAADE